MYWSQMMPDAVALLVSTPFDDISTRAVVSWIRAELRPSRIVAINTHFHADGAGGNAALVADGIEVWASEATAELIEVGFEESRGEGVAYLESTDQADLAARLAAVRSVAPTHTLADGSDHEMSFAGERVRIVDPGPAHSFDNVAVYFPDRGVLFGGCMVRATSSLGHIADADIEHWPAAIEALMELGAQVVVPGHGSVGGGELLDNTAALLAD